MLVNIVKNFQGSTQLRASNVRDREKELGDLVWFIGIVWELGVSGGIWRRKRGNFVMIGAERMRGEKWPLWEKNPNRIRNGSSKK